MSGHPLMAKMAMARLLCPLSLRRMALSIYTCILEPEMSLLSEATINPHGVTEFCLYIETKRLQAVAPCLCIGLSEVSISQVSGHQQGESGQGMKIEASGH